MNKRWKRLFSVVLAVLMIIGAVPLSAPMTARAATPGQVVYFNSKNISWFANDGSEPKVIFKKSTDYGADIGTWTKMTWIENGLWSATVPEGALYVQFTREIASGHNGGTDTLSLEQGENNCFVPSSWDGNIWNNAGYWEKYTPQGGGEDPEPTPTDGYFNIKADLVDYYNNHRVYNYDRDLDDNEGNQTGGDSNQQPFGQFNQWLSGLPGYATVAQTDPDMPKNEDGTKTIYFATYEPYANPKIHFWGGILVNNTMEMESVGTVSEYSDYYLWKANIPFEAEHCLFARSVTGTWDKFTEDLDIEKNLFVHDGGKSGYWEWYNVSTSGPQDPIPLYFGALYNASQAGGFLNSYYKAANVALEYPSETFNLSAYGIAGENLVDGSIVMANSTEDNPVYMPMFREGAYADQNQYMTFYNGLEFPFSTDRVGDVTTYYFDSAKHSVYYDYNSRKLVRDDTINYSVSAVKNKGYFPFNSSSAFGQPDAVNCGFGTKLTIPFTVTENGIDANGDDITFEFTGDDDVWVYIDGALVLDMGGAHSKATGTINFKDRMSSVTTGAVDARFGGVSDYVGGRATVTEGDVRKPYNKEFNDINVKLADGTTTTLDKHIFDGEKPETRTHTLTMFYMERGMLDSNMSVKFSFTPLPTGLSLSKDVNVDAVNSGLQTEAKEMDVFDFTIEDDSSWGDEYKYVKSYYGEKTESAVTLNKKIEGMGTQFYAKDFEHADGTRLNPGTKFTIQEVNTDSEKYTTRWFVTDISTGETVAKAEEAGQSANTAVFDFGTINDKTADYNVNFVNTMKTGNVTVTKNWDSDIEPSDDKFRFTILVDLDGDEDKYDYAPYMLDYTRENAKEVTGADGTFAISANETVIFEGIPVGAKVKITEADPGEGANWKQAGEDAGDVTETATPIVAGKTQALDITNVLNEKEKNTVIYAEAGSTVVYAPVGVTITNVKAEENDTIAVALETGADEEVTGKATFKAEEANKKHVVEYTGTGTDGIYKGTITVYTYCATDKTYVFDYGLKSDIAAINANKDGLFEGGVFYNVKAKDADATTATFGKAENITEGTQQTSITAEESVTIQTDGSADKEVWFQPDKFMSQVESYKYTANITKNGATLPTDPETGTVVNGTIKVMPANVVYYEDNFKGQITYEGGFVNNTNGIELTQSNDQSENYGHDDAYNNGEVKDSAGGSTELTASGVKTKATFTFTGTGFDIVGRTNTESAGLVYQIYKPAESEGEKDELVKLGVVDTYYANGDLYQIPVIHTEMDEYGTYKVVLVISGKDTTFYLDGVRIYNPLGEDAEEYLETEKDVTVSKVIDLIIGNGQVTETGVRDESGAEITYSSIPESKAALLNYNSDDETKLSALGYAVTEDVTTPDGEGDFGYTREVASIIQVMHSGPKNELYLSDGRAIAFVAEADDTDSKTLQVEAKMVNTSSSDEAEATSVDLRYLDNNQEPVSLETITTATAMYYEIPVEECIELEEGKYLVVLLGNWSDNYLQVLSFTNIKVKGYTLSNPYDSEAAKELIDTAAIEEPSRFVEFTVPQTQFGRKKAVTAQVVVSAECLESMGAKPTFALYYANGGEMTKITVTPTKNGDPKEDGSQKFNLRFVAPNAIGTFPLELHYVSADGEESAEYISASINVKK